MTNRFTAVAPILVLGLCYIAEIGTSRGLRKDRDEWRAIAKDAVSQCEQWKKACKDLEKVTVDAIQQRDEAAALRIALAKVK